MTERYDGGGGGSNQNPEAQEPIKAVGSPRWNDRTGYTEEREQGGV